MLFTLCNMQDSGVDLLTVLGDNPFKYALSLMNELFSEEEMGTSWYSASYWSTKPNLPHDRRELLEGIFSDHHDVRVLTPYTGLLPFRCTDGFSSSFI